ncbi:MAG: Polysaccharide biosynthesis protein [Candidatus Daviesbacteria bacterium GW2011_GWA1_36_8]|uniref:Polysaccharide biosynthesis protein n=1 Tax=Candidatus Daviesbacteria bacterium GW2011_GWA1_36_8 TaxID=1618417 RepID=A0A0G0F689_9BACT|nr:MAG: Polysaccharide biosynthesis protein [Candidatus Daviesbacteria bacterium GW2011_GWA1_36_8]
MEPTQDHLDPTAEISLETVKKRSVKGVVTLTARYFVLYGITAVAQIFLGVYLTRGEYGVFGVVSAAVNFFIYFSDIGLAAALIQKKEKPTQTDLKTTFTIQQVMVVTLLIILFLLTPKITESYGLSLQGKYLIYALGFGLMLSSLKTIPTVLLERQIEFGKIAISNILENLSYNIVLVLLAWKGFGVTSFTLAILTRGVIGVISMYILRPWKPGFAFSFTSLKKLLRYGLPYQFNSLIALFKDDGIALTLGKIIGLDAFGLLIWAQKWIQMPLRIFLDTITKVTFPAFARMQDEKEHLRATVTRSIFVICVLVFPSVAGMLITAPVILRVLPQYEKWLPALFPMALLSVNVLFASVTTQLTNLLNSIGKIKLTTVFMIMWAALTWILVPYLATKQGLTGAALGYALVGSSSVVVIFIVKRYVNFSLSQSAIRPLIATLAMSFVLLVLRPLLPFTLYSVLVLALTGISVYMVSLILLVGPTVIQDVKKAFKTLISR